MADQDIITPGRGASRSLAERLREAVKAGHYRPGDQLPPLRQLMAEFDLGYSTVNRAIEILAADGLVEARRGSGTYVRGQETEPGTRRLSIFALVVPEIRAGYYPALVKGFDDAAGELNYSLVISSTDNDFRKQADVILQLLDKSVAGVALLPADTGSPPRHQIRQLQRCGVPVVLLHRGVDGISAPLISLDFAEIARAAARALVANGHRRLAFFDTHSAPPMNASLDGFRDVVEPCGGQLMFTHCGNYTHEEPTSEVVADAKAAIDRMLGLPKEHRVTGIYSTWDPYSEIIYASLRERGMRIPEDVSVVSFGGAWRGGVAARRFTAATVDEAATGRLAARLLVEMCKGDRAIDNDGTFPIPLGWAEGQTLGPAPASQST